MARRVGVLALQGGFAAHTRALADIGVEPVLVREAAALDELDGLILPGGESTTHLKLIHRFGLAGPLDAFARSGRPMLCTCAGLILAARSVVEPAQPSFGWLDVEVARNAWGRQVHSFEAVSDAPPPGKAPAGDATPLSLLFIRAPRIRDVGRTEVLATFEGEPIMVRQGAVVGATFHPELTADRRVHQRVFQG